ncbi:MAG: M1 family metallopeptidase [Bacteroidota bacterium]
MNKNLLFGILGLLMITATYGQDYRWQQRVEYFMDIDMDVSTHRFDGKQKLVYYNNSPDTLTKVFYHLYFNAFQPGSMMDVRSRTISDPDGRVRDRIYYLSDKEIGYQHIKSLKQDGKDTQYKVEGTVLEVTLAKPILPKTKVTFDMEFQGQVPLQIRRSGRDNKEGISYTMTQWYPKLAEYDHMGWHANPYIGREFHSIWGDFDVKITIDPSYVIGGTGILQKPNKIGHGYEAANTKVKPSTKDITWNFVAKNVIDFAWAADPDYTHTTAQVPNGPLLRFFYQKNEKTEENWEKAREYMVRAVEYINKHFGEYQYDEYAFIQGGDGGMEYPMATMITGERSLGSLIGVMTHELLHSWYQMMLATNESLYAWMDEGFTTYATNETMNYLFGGQSPNPHAGNYGGYFALVKSGLHEPQTEHSDHYNTNRAYGTNAYSKGAVFLNQLKYIVGKETFDKAILRYFNTWKFRHPEPNDFIRIFEKESGMELDWYLNYFIRTTKTTDYGIKNVFGKGNATFVTLERVGDMPMPLDVQVTYKDGSTEIFYIPMRIMRGEKPAPSGTKFTVKEDWPWVYPTYTFEVSKAVSEITKIVIDPSGGLADLEKDNNTMDFSEGIAAFEDPTK